jgi:hypothetical protein
MERAARGIRRTHSLAESIGGTQFVSVLDRLHIASMTAIANAWKPAQCLLCLTERLRQNAVQVTSKVVSTNARDLQPALDPCLRSHATSMRPLQQQAAIRRQNRLGRQANVRTPVVLVFFEQRSK